MHGRTGRALRGVTLVALGALGAGFGPVARDGGAAPDAGARDAGAKRTSRTYDARSARAEETCMERCTLYSRRVDFTLAQHLRQALGARVEVTGTAQEWTRIEAQLGGATVTFNSLRFTGPMDPFSKIILGTAAHVQRLGLPAEEEAQLKRVAADTKWLVGVVSSTSLEDPGPARQLVGAAAHYLEAHAFTGHTLVPPARAFPAQARGDAR